MLTDPVLVWAPLIAAGLHIFEEFVFPGGFTAWYHRYRPDAATSFTPRFAVIINAVLIGVCLLIPIQGLGPRGVAAFLTVLAVLVGNAVFHIRATWRGREYSPGLVTSVLLYLPLGVLGYLHFLRTGRASLGTTVGAALLGGSYNLISVGMHRLRARRAAQGRP